MAVSAATNTADYVFDVERNDDVILFCGLPYALFVLYGEPSCSGSHRRAASIEYQRKSRRHAEVSRLLSVLLGREGRKDLAGDRQVEF